MERVISENNLIPPLTVPNVNVQQSAAVAAAVATLKDADGMPLAMKK